MFDTRKQVILNRLDLVVVPIVHAHQLGLVSIASVPQLSPSVGSLPKKMIDILSVGFYLSCLTIVRQTTFMDKKRCEDRFIPSL